MKEVTFKIGDLVRYWDGGRYGPSKGYGRIKAGPEKRGPHIVYLIEGVSGYSFEEGSSWKQRSQFMLGHAPVSVGYVVQIDPTITNLYAGYLGVAVFVDPKGISVNISDERNDQILLHGEFAVIGRAKWDTIVYKSTA